MLHVAKTSFSLSIRTRHMLAHQRSRKCVEPVLFAKGRCRTSTNRAQAVRTMLPLIQVYIRWASSRLHAFLAHLSPSFAVPRSYPTYASFLRRPLVRRIVRGRMVLWGDRPAATLGSNYRHRLVRRHWEIHVMNNCAHLGVPVGASSKSYPSLHKE